MQAENFGQTWLEIDLPFPCEIHHCYPRAQPDPSRFRVLTHYGEPSPLLWDWQQVRDHAGHFDLIVTADERLSSLSNVVFMVLGDTWIKSPPKRKEFDLSFLWSAGIGAAFDGYAMRERVWAIKDQLNVPHHFWYSKMRQPKGVTETEAVYPGADKVLLFDSMFSVVIENTREKNYFTEKIIDAFQSFTVPVYFGCPNIDYYFDMSGVIVFADEKDFIDKMNGLSEADYWGRMPAMLRNKQASDLYCNPLQRLKSVILAKKDLAV